MSLAEPQRDDTVYRVVINDEEQFSIWPASRRVPAGWRDAGVHGQKSECLAHIRTVWTDLRPLSVRRNTNAADQKRHGDPEPGGPPAPPEDDLVARLSAQEHQVEPVLRPDRSARALKERLDRGSVFLRFFGARGTTDLPIGLEAPTAGDADFDRQQGTVHIDGAVTLNGIPIVCSADIELETLRGVARVRVRDAREARAV